MKTIKLTQGKIALVDDADFDAVNAHKWCAHEVSPGCFYATRNIRNSKGKKTLQRLHQFLLPDAKEVDHRDGNKLNYQRHNLRPATHKQNMQGFRQKKLGTTSKFRGIDWYKPSGKWRAQIEANGKKIYIGYFYSETDAARARDAAALKYHGKFASLNFPIT